MYRLITQYADVIVATIDADFVSEYDWLLSNIADARTAAYQRRYRRYWAMNAAQLSPDFYAAYFNALEKAREQPPSLYELCITLHQASVRRDGIRKSVQFSFTTKLLHMVNPRLPVYDSRIARFYFFNGPATDLSLDKRISELVTFHTFLVEEYARVLDEGLLTTAIEVLRKQRKPLHYTAEKCIDSLLWAFVTVLEKGGLPNRQIVYP